MKRFLKILLFIIIAAGVAIGSVLTIRAVNNRGAAPVAWWKMDEEQGQTTYDASGNGNNGTLGASTSDTTPDPTWKNEESCKNGKCLQFDGTDDYVDINGNPDLLRGSRTYSLWFYPHFNSDSVIMQFMFASNVSGDAGSDITLYSAGNGFYGVAYKAGGSANYVSAGSFMANNWYHIVATFDDNTNEIKVYHNGVLKNEDTESNAMTAGTVTTRIGSSGLYGYPFDGLIDDVRVYNYARTAAQIKADYNKSAGGKGASVKVASLQEQQNASDGLVAYWKMDEASWAGVASEVVDSSGNANHGTAAGGATKANTTSTAKFGMAGSFDGTDDYVNAGTNTVLNITSSVTMEAWIKPTDLNNYHLIASKGLGGHTYSMQTVGAFVEGQFYTGSAWVSLRSTATLVTGNWYHIVYVFDDTANEVRLYINSVGKTLTGVTTNPESNPTEPFLIGDQNISPSYPFNGQIDDVKIYNTARTAEQIRRDYESGPPPVAHWKMDENSGQYAYDTSGTNNGTLGSGATADIYDPTWTNGKYGNALKFDGSNDYVDIGDIDLVNGTITAWIKPISTSGSKVIVAKAPGDGSSINADITYVVKDGTLQGILGNNTDYQGYVDSGLAITANVWQFVVISVDGTNINFWVNGGRSSIAQTLIPAGNQYKYSIGRIGEYANPNYCFNGLIDDVRIYNYARTQRQIMEDMNVGHPASAGASAGNAGSGRPGSYAGYWNFDEGNGDTAYDKSVNQNNGDLAGSCPGAVTCPAWTTAGKFGRALSFDGGDYVSIPDSSSLRPSNFSVSFWAKPDTINDWYRWMGKDHASYTGFILLRSNTNSVYMAAYDAGGTERSSPQISYTVGEWAFFSFTFDGTYIRAYKNGVEITPATNVGAWTFAPSTSGLFYIGRAFQATYYKGLFDEVKFYPFALSPLEIKEEFNRGSSLKLGASSTASDGVTPSDSQDRSYCVSGDVSACAAPIAHWKMDEAQAQYAYDTSGNANTGTLGTGNTADASDPQWKYGDYCKTGSCLSFDGSDDYVNAGQGSSLNGLTSVTLSAWIKPYGYSSNYRSGIISRRRGSGAYEGLNFDMGGALEVPYRLGIYEAGSAALYANTVISPNQWSFVTATLSGTDAKIYINGVLDASGTLSWNWSSDVDVLIGMVYPGYYEYNFNGLIDDARIYNYARTPAQIAWDYNRGAPVAHWKMNDGQDTATTCDGTGTVVKDSSGNNNTGALTLGATPTPANAWSEGKYGCGITFDGSDDYVDAGSAANLDNLTAYTYSAWIKPASVSLDYQVIVGKNDPYAQGALWFLGAQMDGIREYSITNAESSSINPCLTANEWQFVTMTYNEAGDRYIRLYRNGIEVSGHNSYTASVGTLVSDADRNLNIGIGSSRWPFNGLIDDVRIYNYALTATQIKTLYNEGAAVRFGPTEGLP